MYVHTHTYIRTFQKRCILLLYHQYLLYTKALKGVMGVPVPLVAGPIEDEPCVQLTPQFCSCWSGQCLQQWDTKHHLFGVSRRKLFPMLGFSHRALNHPGSPSWGLRGCSPWGRFGVPACMLSMERGLHTLGSNSYAPTCIQVQNLYGSFCGISILFLRLLLLSFPLLCFAFFIYKHTGFYSIKPNFSTKFPSR